MSKQRAVLYRMHTENHVCPFGLRSKDLLESKGYKVEDHKLRSREKIDAFKAKYSVETTPQSFINEERIGGYDSLRRHFNMGEAGQNGTTYTPVIAIFGIAACTSLAVLYNAAALISEPSSFVIRFVELFIAFSMVILAIQKLQDLYSFANSFITYDLLAMRHLRYAYVYPFAEAFAGIGMLSALSGLIVGPVSFFIGTVGAVSVIKAVYIDNRELKCACVGGNSNVPLGFISLTENLFMIAAGVWMISAELV